jgi:hypothetical protein
MADDPPLALTASERARRVFLAPVEEALAARNIAGLTLTYRALPARSQPAGPGVTALVITYAGVADEVQVRAVTATRRTVSTQAESGDADSTDVLDQLRASVRRLGIAAVTGTYRTADPFPGNGTPEYEVSICVPVTVPPKQGADRLWPVEQRHTTDPGTAVNHVIAWVEANTRRYPPTPYTAANGRAIAQARRAALAGIDWTQVAAWRDAGDLPESWQLAGVAVAFAPDDPDAGIEGPEIPPAASTIPVAEQLTRRLAASDLAALVDQTKLAGQIEQLLASLPPLPPAPAPPAAPVLTPAARAALRADLTALDPRQLLWHLPRDERGRLVLGEQVLLASYETVAPIGKDRQVWLIAALPARRRDPQAATLRLAALIGVNHIHRWDNARWRWDASAPATAETRWGVAGLSLSDGAPDTTTEPDTPALRASRSLRLQDAGQFAEALALYGIELAPEVARLAQGAPLGWLQRQQTEPWARAVQETLHAAALWRFAPLLVEAAAERARWLAEKRGRRRPLPSLRLVRLPKQVIQRKAVLVLAAREPDGGRPLLTLEWTGANDLLPAASWRRDLDLDLLRFGLITPAELPYRV